MASYNFVCLVGKDIEIVTDQGEYTGKVKQVFDDFIVLTHTKDDTIIKRSRIVSVKILVDY